MRHIKKYGNRRLYDTAASAYVNLTDLAALIREGETIVVTDAKTDEDLTRTVLLQLLTEQYGARVLPVGLLHRMLRLSIDTPMHRAAVEQLGFGLQMLDQQLAAEAQFPWMRPTPTTRPPAGPPPEAEPEEEVEPPVDPELAALRERLSALEERLRGA